MKVGENLVIVCGDEVLAFVDGKWGGKIALQNRLSEQVGKVVYLTTHSNPVVVGFPDEGESEYVNALAQAMVAFGGRFQIVEAPEELLHHLYAWSEDSIHEEASVIPNAMKGDN